MTEKVQTTTLRYCQCEFTAIFWFCVDDATHNLKNCCLLFFELHGVTQSHCIRSIHLSAHFYKCNCNFSQSAYFRLKNRNRDISLPRRERTIPLNSSCTNSNYEIYYLFFSFVSRIIWYKLLVFFVQLHNFHCLYRHFRLT